MSGIRTTIEVDGRFVKVDAERGTWAWTRVKADATTWPTKSDAHRFALNNLNTHQRKLMHLEARRA